MLDKILEFIEENCDWPTILLVLFLLSIMLGKVVLRQDGNTKS